MRLTGLDRWIAIVRAGAVPFAVFQIAISSDYPPHYRLYASLTAGVLAAAAAVFWMLSGRELRARTQTIVAMLALAVDTAVVSAFVLIYHYEPATPTRQLLFLPLVEGAVRFALPGALAIAVASLPVAAVVEGLRSDRFGTKYHYDFVTFQLGVELIMALIVGWLVRQLWGERDLAEARAVEAEGLREELEQRVDLVEAANRCARALGSSLDLDESFAAFLRELATLIPFDRVAIVLEDQGEARVMATAGTGVDSVFPSGSSRPIGASVLARVLQGETVYRPDLSSPEYPEEHELLKIGVLSRAVPLWAGGRSIGMLSVQRTKPHAFEPEEVELATLLGRLVGTAVQNIHAYEAEHATAKELRRLSALRADFVSLVSHELRSPMAAVIGSARTLQSRWRELEPSQRESFLALIGDETDRLAALVSDVLDTSRIEAGTFSFTFSDVDLGELVRETVATASVGQDEVRIDATVQHALPHVRADRERLRQVLLNLIDNAVKYSPAGGEVTVAAASRDGVIELAVADRGPGVPPAQQTVIFEKFGRAGSDRTKPGTGLGLFIARSIAEAHGGTLRVRSTPPGGATFTLCLPVPAPRPASA
jgi:signal transduction histidine kinase